MHAAHWRSRYVCFTRNLESALLQFPLHCGFLHSQYRTWSRRGRQLAFSHLVTRAIASYAALNKSPAVGHRQNRRWFRSVLAGESVHSPGPAPRLSANGRIMHITEEAQLASYIIRFISDHLSQAASFLFC